AADVPQPENVRDLLEAVLKAETETVVRYEKRKKQAEELGFTELAVQLDDMISDETRHKEEVEKILYDERFKISISIIKEPWRIKSSRSFVIKNPSTHLQEEGRKSKLKIKPLLVDTLYLVFVS